jgi:hypothetical protein
MIYSTIMLNEVNHPPFELAVCFTRDSDLRFEVPILRGEENGIAVVSKQISLSIVKGKG